MIAFGIFRRWLFLALAMALLCGCSLFEDAKEISSTELVGFASDTTAILFRYSWETTSSSCVSHFCSSTDYLDVELQLVDVRFHKVYWKSKIKNNYGRSFYVEQWSDSAIYFRSGGGGMAKYWLWNIGNSKPKEVSLNWNTEEENLFKPNNYRWFRWENDSIVAGKFIIDTKTMTVNKWEPPACSDWWGKDIGGVCLVNEANSCDFALFSEKGDSLDSFAYAHGCDKFRGFTIHRYFIEASLGRCYPNVSTCYTYPIEVQPEEPLSVMIKYDERGNLSKESLFWRYGTAGFVDAVGNIVRY